MRPALGALIAGALLASSASASSAPPPPLLALPLRPHAPDALSLLNPLSHFPGRRLAAPSSSSSSSPAYPLSGSSRDQGVFTIPMALGNPPQILNAIVDTGSTLTAFTCAGCAAGECGTSHGVFDPDASSTAVLPTCTDPACECGDPACTCGPSQTCAYRRAYAESSSTAGILVTDGLSLPPGLGGGGGGGNATTARVSFGCALRETGSIKAQPAAGITGLGADGVGLVDQLAAAGALAGPAFALCLAPPPDSGGGPAGGALLLGPGLPAGLAGARAVSTPLLKGQASFYTVGLESMALGSGDGAAPLETDPPQPGIWATGHGVVLDSGTTYTYLPTPAFKAFLDGVEEAAAALGAARAEGPDPAFPDVCWGGVGMGAFPNLTLTLAPGAATTPLSLPPRNYLFPHPSKRNAACLGVFDNGDGGTILGGITFLDTLVQLDRRAGAGGGRGLAHFYGGVDCAGLGKAAEASLKAGGGVAGAPAEAPATNPKKRRSWVEVLIAGGVLVTLGVALALCFNARRGSEATTGTAGTPPPPPETTGDARSWWRWPNFAGPNPSLPARWWWMPDFSPSNAPPGVTPTGRQWEALDGDATSALGLAAPVGRSGIVVTPVAEEVEMGRAGAGGSKL